MNTSRDCALSGYCPKDFESVATNLSRMSINHKITEINAWDFAERFDRTNFCEGTDLQDASGLLEFNFTQMKRVAVIFRNEFEKVHTNVVVELRRWDRGCLLDGMIYLETLLNEKTGATRRLEELAAFIAEVAVATEATLINLVDEDFGDVVSETVPVKEPLLFTVVRAAAFPDLITNAPSKEEIIVSWLQSPEAFLTGERLDPERKRELNASLAKGLERFL